MSKQKICVLNTGGTVSCVGNPLSPMSAVDFATACRSMLDPVIAGQLPEVEVVYDTSLRFPASANGLLDSTNLQPTDWCLIASFILENYAAYDGFVVMHGTDSMDFTGSALPFLLNVVDEDGAPVAVLSKPVILTGSQLPMFHQSPDGGSLGLNFNTDAFQNFCGAVACATRAIPEVCVYFATRLYRGSRVMKVSTNEFAAFESPNYPALGRGGIELRLDADRIVSGPANANLSLDEPVALARAKAQLAGISRDLNANRVMQLNAFPAFFDAVSGQSVIASVIDACVDAGILGLVLEAYGAGNFPSGAPDKPSQGGVYQALKRAHDRGVVVVNCSRVIAGAVDSGAYASGAWLPEVGVLNGADMTPMAAFAKTMILLSAAAANGWAPATVERLIQTNLTGEMRASA